jgi:hypothetical protein
LLSYFHTMIRFLAPLFFIGLLSGCAQQVPPTGGPKDETPPTLVSTLPTNQTINFKGNEVDLEFDEYVSVDNINQQLLITPEIDGIYTTKIRTKGVRLIFDKPFQPNTTYSLNFRNTFKDVSERNPARNVKVVFSTGPTIDSLSVSGEVVDALTNKPVLETLVGLYRLSDTLQFARNRPYYFAKTDSAGLFQLENIAAGTYRLAALTDANNNLLYDAAKESIGFLSDTLAVRARVEGIRLPIRFIDQVPNKVVTTRSAAGTYTVVYGRGVKDLRVQFQNPADSLPYALSDERQLLFYNLRNETDTVRAAITVVDSVDQRFAHDVKIKFRPRGRREEATRLPFTLKASPADREEVERQFSYQIDFTKPVGEARFDSVEVLIDTTRRLAIPANEWNWNATRTRLSIAREIPLQREVRVTLRKGAFFSIEGDTSQVSRTNHPLKDPENYGVIAGEVRGGRGGVLVQLLSEDYKVVRTLTNRRQFRFEYVKPGRYYLRAIEDANSNEKWDTGDARRFELAERIVFYPQPIVIKANFEVEDHVLTFD